MDINRDKSLLQLGQLLEILIIQWKTWITYTPGFENSATLNSSKVIVITSETTSSTSLKTSWVAPTSSSTTLKTATATTCFSLKFNNIIQTHIYFTGSHVQQTTESKSLNSKSQKHPIAETETPQHLKTWCILFSIFKKILRFL